MPKRQAPLIAPASSLGTITAFRGQPLTGAIQPVHSFGEVVGEYFIDAATIRLRVRHLTGPITAPTLTNLGLVTVPAHASPPDAPALGSATLLSEGGKFTGTTTDTLTVHNVQAADDGRPFRLQAIVVNPSCSAFSDSATLSAMSAGLCPPCPDSGGDMDHDGDFDLVDMQQFTVCFGVDETVQPACACGNLDAGNDIVDLADWSALEQLIGGPQQSPADRASGMLAREGVT